MFIKRGSMAGSYHDWTFPYLLIDGDEGIECSLPTEGIPLVEPQTQQIAVAFGQPQKLNRLKEKVNSLRHLAEADQLIIRGDTLEIGFKAYSNPPWDLVESAISGTFCLDIRG
jgi:hypothetical protein